LVSYRIDFEFKNSFYESVSSYFLSFLGKTTFNAFVKRAENLRSNYLKEIENTKKEELETQSTFRAKTEGLKKEFYIFEILNYFVKNQKLTEDELKLFKEIYNNDRRFSTKIHALFNIFNSKELVKKNEEKVIYHIKSSLTSFF